MSVVLGMPSQGVGANDVGHKKTSDDVRPLKKVVTNARKPRIYSPESGEVDSDLMTSLDMLHNRVEQNLCIEMLTDGCVESYCQFFKASEALIHTAQPPSSHEGASARVPQPSSSEGDNGRLISLKVNLMRSEQAMRKGSHVDVYDALAAVAAQFQSEGNYKDEQRFLDQCLDISTKIEDGNERHLEAQCKMGAAYENEGDLLNAITYYSAYYNGCGLETSNKKKACALLVRAEIESAREMAGNGDVEDAIAKLRACFERTKETDDPESMCKLYFDLGKHHLTLKEHAKSIAYYEMYFDIAAREKNDINCGCVCAALATTCESMGEPERTIAYLERYLQYVKGHSAAEEAKACQRLGEVYLARQEHVKAVIHLQKYFDIIKERANGETPELTSARIRIGIARANLKMSNFIQCLQSNGPKDLQELITWKNTRDDKCFEPVGTSPSPEDASS